MANGGLEKNEPSKPLPLPARFGRYRLNRLLAVGGMAQIYLAKSFGAEGFVKPLVIKRLDPRLADNKHFTSLFINEAKLLVTLNHGNIVPVFDFGRMDDDLYMAMEYIPGASLLKVLQSLVKSKQYLDMQLAAHVGAEICKGLDYAHRKTDSAGKPAGIIHRDIKPTNILISFEGEVKIVDFGVAKLASRLDPGGVLTGTLAYMSPEQAERLAVDPRTDVFSAGLVLYELLSRKRAYRAKRPLDALALAQKARLKPLPDRVPRELQEIVERATRRAPEERFGSAHEMEQALSEFLLLARSAGATMDSTSLSSRLSALMKNLPIEREPDVPADATAPDEMIEMQVDSHAGRMVSGLIEIEDPPDVELIQSAAETFHSEFLTRVLAEEQGKPATRRWILGVAAGSLAALVLAGTLIFLFGSAPVEPPATSPIARPAPKNTRPGPKVALRADVREAPSPPDAAVTATRSSDGPRHRSAPSRRRTRFGYLNLNSVPWSQVTIDGRRYRRPTPLLKIKLRAGTHTVVLRNSKRNLKKKVRIKIRPGVTTWKVIKLR